MYGEGMELKGVTSKFGLIGIGMLMLVGLLIIVVSDIAGEKDLKPISIELQASPYRTPKLKNSILLPLTDAKVIALDPATFAASDTNQLFALQKGEKLIAYLPAEEAMKWKDGVGRKDFYKALLLQKADNSWLVDYPSYKLKAQRLTSQGWWLIILGAILIPYQLVAKPKIPFWVSLLLYIGALLMFYFI
jgi:hypothetical protein